MPPVPRNQSSTSATTSSTTMRHDSRPDQDHFEVQFEEANFPAARQHDDQDQDENEEDGRWDGPVDLDELFYESQNQFAADMDDNGSLFDEEDEYSHDDEYYKQQNNSTLFANPHKRLLDNDASLIPGSPFSKPSLKRSNRPTEPLAIAKYASTVAFLVTIGWVIFLVISACWNYNSVGRIIVEILLALLSFFGLFWNSYFITAMIFKCFIPAKAFLTNTKYCSIIPERKPPTMPWLDVTIQIPVYKESLHEVLMPTLKSCLAARDHYIKSTSKTASCNIVICDDGMMALLRDNFAAAEMLWKQIHETSGRVFRLSRLLKHVPRASRRHLKGLRSKDVYEVFHRMLFYYHYKIGFVARSTVDRRGKFKKASNLNSHLRLALGAQQRATEEPDLTIADALLQESHNDDGSRYVMFGNDICVGHLICINDADARMSSTVIHKTVPEFLNDATLGFTQHATKTLTEQRNESYYTKMLSVYTDALYQGHFLLSSVLGCHPPLVGHSIFLRTEAINQVGRMRTLRKAQHWLRNIGLQFLPVDQVGFSNLQAQNRTEYWSESHVSEDFELMIHLYNLGFNGRYCAYPDTEFQEGITRTFDEEAGRHRKFSLGAHELVFNPFQDILGHGVFTPLFKTFLRCDIPSYYKVFLTAYLCSYTAGGAYILVFIASAIVRIIDKDDALATLYAFSPAGVIILNWIIYYVLGYFTFIISLLRIFYINNKLLFPEYRKRCCGAARLVYTMLRHCLVFNFLFYNVAAFTFYFLGSMDHLMSRPGIVSATNKDSINIGRCRAFWDMANFNSGSWLIAFVLGGLAYATMVQEYDWDVTKYPDTQDAILQHALFAGPAIFLALMAAVVPIILNPWILGWPFLRQKKKPKTKPQLPRQSSKKTIKKSRSGREVVDIPTFMNAAKELNNEIERAQNKPDVELGSLATKEFSANSPRTVNNSNRKTLNAAYLQSLNEEHKRQQQQQQYHQGGMRAIADSSRQRREQKPGSSRPSSSSGKQRASGSRRTDHVREF